MKLYQEAHFSASFLNMQAELVFSCQGENDDYLMHRNATAMHMEFCHALLLCSCSTACRLLI
jgi:hypothetical protein